MKAERFVKDSFSIIGKMGSTRDGAGFIAALWADANAHFSEIAHLAAKQPGGLPAGIWGAMSDFTLSFRPWEKDFSEGLYLAGVECTGGAEPPAGWTKWTLPGFEYLKTENTGPSAFREMLGCLQKNGLTLAGAVQELTDPAEGKEYLLFPVRRL